MSLTNNKGFLMFIRILTLFLLLGCVKTQEAWAFEKVDGKEIYFKGNKVYETGLYELSFHGKLSDDKGSPFFILSGKKSENTDENIALYIYKFNDDKSFSSEKYTFPGKVSFWHDNSLMAEYKVFWGECLKGEKNTILWYQKELDDDDKWITSTYKLQIINGSISESFTKEPLDINLTLEQLKLKKCIQIIGVDRTSEP